MEFGRLMDIDIDLQSSFDAIELFDCVQASMVTGGEIKKHPAGAYLQKMPIDPISKLAAIPYDVAESKGYIKIDFLHLNILNTFKSKDEIRELLNKEPDWYLLRIPSVVKSLFQIHKHFDLIQRINPNSVQDLADCISLIRPSKYALVDAYLASKKVGNLNNFRNTVLYVSPKDGSAYYKKSHATAYALTITLQLHTIKISKDSEKASIHDETK